MCSFKSSLDSFIDLRYLENGIRLLRGTTKNKKSNIILTKLQKEKSKKNLLA